MTTRALKPAFELRGRHVLAILLVAFGSFITIDVMMAVQAYRTFPGEVSAKPYEEGLQFNRTLAQRAEERTLGWTAKVDASVAAVGRMRLEIIIADRAGKPVRGLKLNGRLQRPATEAGAVARAFTETRPGVYEAFAPETPGAWDLAVSGTDRAGHAFEAQRRMVWR